MMQVRGGATRTVILTKKWAIKLPGVWGRFIWEWRDQSFRYACWNWWKGILRGLLANMQERNFHTIDNSRLCPILFSMPGGFIVIMPYAQPLALKEWDSFDFEDFQQCDDYELPVENKHDSFGWLDGRIVAVDYGS